MEYYYLHIAHWHNHCLLLYYHLVSYNNNLSMCAWPQELILQQAHQDVRVQMDGPPIGAGAVPQPPSQPPCASGRHRSSADSYAVGAGPGPARVLKSAVNEATGSSLTGTNARRMIPKGKVATRPGAKPAVTKFVIV